MADETKTVILTQNAGDRLAVEQGGSVALHGESDKPALQHAVVGEVVHGTAPKRPLVHMVCWDTEEPCKVTVDGRVQLVGDEKAPLRVHMEHEFLGEHRQTLTVKPLDHRLKVDSALANPIHHALQMRTPLQVRFCNPWHVASDYHLEMRVGQQSLVSIRLTGATVATPQPCPDDRCPEPAGQPVPSDRL